MANAKGGRGNDNDATMMQHAGVVFTSLIRRSPMVWYGMVWQMSVTDPERRGVVFTGFDSFLRGQLSRQSSF